MALRSEARPEEWALSAYGITPAVACAYPDAFGQVLNKDLAVPNGAGTSTVDDGINGHFDKTVVHRDFKADLLATRALVRGRRGNPGY